MNVKKFPEKKIKEKIILHMRSEQIRLQERDYLVTAYVSQKSKRYILQSRHSLC